MADNPLVLLVDDEKSFRNFFLERLNPEVEQGLIDVKVASNARQGLKIIKENNNKDNPALVIIDMILPGMSGEKLVSEINVEATQTKGILISAHKPMVELEKIKDNYEWITNCLTKPLTLTVFNQIIRNFLNNPDLNKSALSEFGYGNLDGEAIASLREETEKIKSLMKRTAEDIIEIGGRLEKIKKTLGHGNYKRWIKDQLSLDYTTANNFTKVFKTFSGRKEEVARIGLNVSVLYLMSSRNTPEGFCDEVFQRAEAGYPLSLSEAKQLKKEYLERSKFQTNNSDPQSNSSTNKNGITTIDVSVSPDNNDTFSETRSSLVSPPKIQTKQQQIVGVVRQQKVWELGSHLLYCGSATSPAFRDFVDSLPISFNIGFPNYSDWTPETLFPVKARSTLVYNTLIPHIELSSFLSLVQLSMEFSTGENDKILFSFLPYPELLLLSEKLGCDCFIAEPNPEKCRQIVAKWRQFVIDKKFPFFDDQC